MSIHRICVVTCPDKEKPETRILEYALSETHISNLLQALMRMNNVWPILRDLSARLSHSTTGDSSQCENETAQYKRSDLRGGSFHQGKLRSQDVPSSDYLKDAVSGQSDCDEEVAQ